MIANIIYIRYTFRALSPGMTELRRAFDEFNQQQERDKTAKLPSFLTRFNEEMGEVNPLEVDELFRKPQLVALAALVGKVFVTEIRTRAANTSTVDAARNIETFLSSNPVGPLMLKVWHGSTSRYRFISYLQELRPASVICNYTHKKDTYKLSHSITHALTGLLTPFRRHPYLLPIERQWSSCVRRTSRQPSSRSSTYFSIYPR